MAKVFIKANPRSPLYEYRKRLVNRSS